MSQMPPPVQNSYMKPHRGPVILVLGILGLVMCFILGIVAWVMGNADLREMDAGTMDPSGRGLTSAGKICGMVGTILATAVIAIYALIAVLAIIGGAVGAAGSP